MTLGIISATCSCEYGASNNCICTVSGTAQIQFAGDYIVMRDWWDNNGDLRGAPLYSKHIDAGDPVTFDYIGSFDNTKPDASSYIIVLYKSGEEDKIGQDIQIIPEECTTSPHDDTCPSEFCSLGTYYPETSRDADGHCPLGDVEENSPCCDGNNVVQPHPAGGCHNTGGNGGNGGTDDSCGDGCPNTCDGTSLWSQECVDGHCKPKALIKTNSPYCKHVELPPIEDKSNIYLIIGAIILFILLSRR